MLEKSKVIIRRPRVPVDEKNYRLLQFFDLIKDLDYLAEISGEDLQVKLRTYLQRNCIRFSDLEQYFKYYPDCIYKNLYETRLLYGISS